MAFSFAHIVGPFWGMQFAYKLGYNSVWLLMGVISFVAIVMIELLKKELKKRNFEAGKDSA